MAHGQHAGDATPGDYTAIIRRLAPGEDPRLVEAWLRARHGTLASMDPVYFAREVKAAAADLHAERNKAG